MSKRIATVFAECKAQKRAAFIPFIMGGDPSFDACAALLDALPEAGADMIELGMPFSDPMADGAIIQAAGLRALAAGTTTHSILALAKTFRENHPNVPLILMGYYNPIYRFGVKAFAKAASEAGVDGIIIVDVPPEEENEIIPHLNAFDIDFVRLVAPTSLGARLPTLLSAAKGYLYYISIAGITGAKAADNTMLASQIATLKSATNLPIAVGFGVKTRKQIEAISAYADGVVVGSAIVAHVAENAHLSVQNMCENVAAFIKTLSGKV